MRNFINAILTEGYQPGQQILITDLYSNDELLDESEALSGYAPPIDWRTPLTIRIMKPDDGAKVMKENGETIMQSFETGSTKRQQALVKRKAKNFDHDRVIVLYDNVIVDGNHHLVAAVMSGNPALYVDLAEWG